MKHHFQVHGSYLLHQLSSEALKSLCVLKVVSRVTLGSDSFIMGCFLLPGAAAVAAQLSQSNEESRNHPGIHPGDKHVPLGYEPTLRWIHQQHLDGATAFMITHMVLSTVEGSPLSFS